MIVGGAAAECRVERQCLKVRYAPRHMVRVVLLINTPHGDREVGSEPMDDAAAKAEIERINGIIHDGGKTILTDWGVFRLSAVVGAFLSDVTR